MMLLKDYQRHIFRLSNQNTKITATRMKVENETLINFSLLEPLHHIRISDTERSPPLNFQSPQHGLPFQNPT